jgi:isochorismate synthase
MDAIVSEVNSLEEFHQLALNERLPFVSYKLPNAKDITTLVQTNSEPIVISSIMDLDGKSGFVFAPFNLSSDYPIWLIRPDLIINGNCFKLSHNQLVKSDFLDTKDNASYSSPHYEATYQEFLNQIQEVHKEMATGTLNKLVLSRISIEKMPKEFNPSAFFYELKDSYPNAFVFMLHIAKIGLWFGASPEPLLQVNNGLVSTVSLAGTRVYNPKNTFSDWGEKELEEQDIVTKYIESNLKAFGVKHYNIEGPKSHSAGTIEHLLTKFSFDHNQLNGRIIEFLNAIHPTPSVCGLPKDIALKAIKSIEKHSREYYTGFLGPIDINSEYNLFVNLRSLKVEKDSLVYFIGAGITSSSDAEKEWEETNNKKSILKSIVEKLNTI